MSGKRVVLGDELPAPEWQRLRGLQVHGEWPGDREARRIPLTDTLSGPAWFGVREAQVRGVDLADRAAPMQAVVAQRAPIPPQGPLKGRPGVAAIVAGALNTIASGPNTSAPIDTPKVKGTLKRGVGRDLTARAKVLGANVGARASSTRRQGGRRSACPASLVKGLACRRACVSTRHLPANSTSTCPDP